MHRDVHTETALIDRCGYRVDQERHVVVHHLDERILRLVAVFLFGRVVYSKQRFAGASLSREVEVIERNARHDFLGAPLKIFIRYAGEILLQKASDFLFSGDVTRLEARCEDGVDDALPGITAAPIGFFCHSDCPGGYTRPERRDFSLQCLA